MGKTTFINLIGLSILSKGILIRSITLSAVILLIAGCDKIVKLTDKEFYQYEPFEAIVLGKEVIPVGSSAPETALTGVDYSIRLRTSNGIIIVVPRLHTSLAGTICGTSDSWAMQELTIGEKYLFPNVIDEKENCTPVYAKEKNYK